MVRERVEDEQHRALQQNAKPHQPRVSGAGRTITNRMLTAMSAISTFFISSKVPFTRAIHSISAVIVTVGFN